MRSWKLIQKEKIELSQSTQTLQSGYARVRITHASLSDSDLQLFTSEGLKESIIPVRHAVGIVSEIDEAETDLRKGDPVAIDPYIPCQECYFCKTEAYSNCINMKIHGVNEDGFLRDFTVLPYSSLKKLPENVRIEDAVYLEYIALAIKIIDRIDLQKGEHIAIVGAGVLGNILAQLAVYYQAIPILIDTCEQSLEIARGIIHYTVKADDNAAKHILEITGGRLAKYTVYITGIKKSFKNTLSYIAEDGTLALTGLVDSSITCNIASVLQKELTVKGIKNGYGEFDTAINMLATKIIDLTDFASSVFKFSQVPEAFEELAKPEKCQISNIMIDCLEE